MGKRGNLIQEVILREVAIAGAEAAAYLCPVSCRIGVNLEWSIRINPASPIVLAKFL